ncbi:MAG: hypothetical protein ASARMPREDX12_009186 [Alectoria sarmentosa]|nr:MAG: hypothetical protein ASARMPRED_009047 [Alectoria sarmentosa]CAD6594510.1 MAG: hypothetical protein ASARMPREDX12_009186 [Alectoria sarmentosa]
MQPIFPLLALIVLPFAFSDPTPLVIPWNTTHSYGPDGPWPVITVQVGSVTDAAGTQPLSTVNLHPGGIWESMILRKDFCNDNGTNAGDGTSPCLAEQAGLYELIASQTVKQDITDEVGLVWQWESNAVDTVSGIAVNVLDTMTIPTLHGTLTVPNCTISAVSAWQVELPDGTLYSAEVGTLSLGAPGTGNQPFSATVTGQTMPGFAYAQGAVASNSWGLHYGSASLNQEGSLVFGGYDQSRVLGDVGVFDVDSAMIANLLDVQIGVENGLSPFSEGSYTGLLKLNASFNGVQPAVINPIVPYLFMSPETCAAVAENLPVTFNSQVGLYIWNTTDPHYERIITSPAYLAFVFQNAGSGNLTIKVPFQLLNLTLEAPIVTITQQYFPCRPFYASDHSGNYFLGKAFLQAAFIGINWQVEKFFLAQAPGPGVGGSNIIPIGPNDTPISTDPIENFAVTWARDWTVLSDDNSSRITTTPSTSATSDNGSSRNTTAHPTGAIPDNETGRNATAHPTDAINESKSTLASGPSSRTKAGIAVGAIVGALAVAGVVILRWLRGRRTAVPPQEDDVPQKQNIWVHEKDGRARFHEIGDRFPHDVQKKARRARLHELGEGLPHEADGDHEIHELDVIRNLEQDWISSHDLNHV